MWVLFTILSHVFILGCQPDDYVSVFSLRNWGKMRNGVLTTEIVSVHALMTSNHLILLQVYIHAKVYIHQSDAFSCMLKFIRSVSWMIV